MDQVAYFRLNLVVNELQQDAYLAHGYTGLPLRDEPKPVAVVAVSLELALDPTLRFDAGVALGIETHDLGIGEQSGDEIEVVERHFTSRKTRRLEDRHRSLKR